MITIAKQDKESVFRQIHKGNIDAIALSSSHLVDDIILSMYKRGIIDCLKKGFIDKRAKNSSIPFEMIMTLAIAAKMKVHTSLTDIPYALSDHRTLSELGYNMVDMKRDINTGLMAESTLRKLIEKYTPEDLITGCIQSVQFGIIKKLKMYPDIHIADTTIISVNKDNPNYEGAGMTYHDGETVKGYKVSSLRGIVGDTGIIEDFRFAAANHHDLEISRKMLMDSPMLKPGDILMNDRGYLSREIINFLKSVRGVDIYIPLRDNMEAYILARDVAKKENKWYPHPNKKRKAQKIALVTDIGPHWKGSDPKHNVDLNACVVWDTNDNEYFVFVTTDLIKTAKQIIQTYELRPEIEEDFRQLKDFWNLEDFESTKLPMITFHIVCTLLGYLFFQLYTIFTEGKHLTGKSLPVILKNYKPEIFVYYVIYSGNLFGVFSLGELLDVYVDCDERIRAMTKDVIPKEMGRSG